MCIKCYRYCFDAYYESTTISLQDHSYVLPPSDVTKERLASMRDTMENLTMQLRNAKDRERRSKATLKSVLEELKEKNLVTEELHQKLNLYEGQNNIIMNTFPED